MKSKFLHKCFVWKCQDCNPRCTNWHIRDRSCGRWGGATNQEDALNKAIAHAVCHFWAGANRVLNNL